MGHNITERDGLFTVREPAWHGLGTVLDDYPTREEAQAIAHPWEPVSEPLFRRVVEVSDDGEPTSHFEEADGFVANVRSDDGGLLGIVSDSFVTVTNDEMYDVAEVLQGEDQEVKFETGGSLKGGAKVWLLLRLNEPLVVAGRHGTETIPYYGLQNAHDASGAFRGQATMTQIVCDNTAQMADLDAQARGTEFVFRHTKSVKERVEEAKEALAGWRESITVWQRLSEHLITVKVTPAQRELFIAEFVPMPIEGLVSDRVVTNVNEARAAIRTILDGPTSANVHDTAYGLVQAAVEYGQHVRRANTKESRFKRAYLDRDRLTTDAVTLAQEVALA